MASVVVKWFFPEVVIGHSNGGLIARWASYQRELKAIITVGTLHSGAQLAQSVLDNSVYLLGDRIRGTAQAALTMYNFPHCCEYGYTDNFLWEARAAALVQEALGIGVSSGDWLTSLS